MHRILLLYRVYTTTPIYLSTPYLNVQNIYTPWQLLRDNFLPEAFYILRCVEINFNPTCFVNTCPKSCQIHLMRLSEKSCFLIFCNFCIFSKMHFILMQFILFLQSNGILVVYFLPHFSCRNICLLDNKLGTCNFATRQAFYQVNLP